MTELIEKTEVAEILRVSPKTVSYLATTNQLPFVRIGKRKILYDKAEIQNYIEQQRNVPVTYNK